MNNERLNLLIQGTTLLSVVVGLALVIWELSQSRDVAEAQLAAEFTSTILSFDLASMGEDAAAAQAKACHQPTELTPADRETLTAFNRAFMGRIFSTLQFRRLGLFDLTDWEYFVRTSAGGVLGTPWGRHQWSRERAWVEVQYPSVAEIFDEVLESIPKGSCAWEDDLAEYIDKVTEGEL